ncbi:MAG: lipopolysaccharide biosynthesis protein, partial [Bacteroidia bacterium]
ILFLSAGYFVEMATGINQVIIVNSKYYRYDAYFVILMVGVIIMANLILIPIYGITGSAIATALMVVTNNAIRYMFLKIKFGMQPYNFNSLKLIFISAIALVPSFFIPFLHDKYTDIAIRSSVVGGIFMLLTLKLEAAPELNIKIRKNLKRFSVTL